MPFCNCRFDSKTGKRIYCELHQKKEHEHRPTYDVVSPLSIFKQGQGISDPLARALYFLLYCSGARIGEAARFQLLGLNVTEEYYFVKMPLEKKRNKNIPHFRETPIPRGNKALCFENEMMAEVLKFLKTTNADYPFWKWGLNSNRPDYMSAYMLRNATMTSKTIIKVKNQWVEKEITRPLLCHWLRHNRASHCGDRKYYDMSDGELRIYFDWSKADMAVKYRHLPEKEGLFEKR